MNFLRKKFKRDAAVSDAVHSEVDGDSSMVLSDKKLDDKSKRRSYFMTRTSSSPLLNKRDVLQAPPPAVLADTAAGAKAVVDGSASRIQRRRSIPGVAYLMAAKRSIASKGATDDISTEADIS
ncbi:hypothetical protein GGF38_005259, partial [Coemansia sp. RSA 25]